VSRCGVLDFRTAKGLEESSTARKRTDSSAGRGEAGLQTNSGLVSLSFPTEKHEPQALVQKIEDEGRFVDDVVKTAVLQFLRARVSSSARTLTEEEFVLSPELGDPFLWDCGEAEDFQAKRKTAFRELCRHAQQTGIDVKNGLPSSIFVDRDASVPSSMTSSAFTYPDMTYESENSDYPSEMFGDDLAAGIPDDSVVTERQQRNAVLRQENEAMLRRLREVSKSPSLEAITAGREDIPVHSGSGDPLPVSPSPQEGASAPETADAVSVTTPAALSSGSVPSSSAGSPAAIGSSVQTGKPPKLSKSDPSQITKRTGAQDDASRSSPTTSTCSSPFAKASSGVSRTSWTSGGLFGVFFVAIVVVALGWWGLASASGNKAIPCSSCRGESENGTSNGTGKNLRGDLKKARIASLCEPGAATIGIVAIACCGASATWMRGEPETTRI